jgi:hypothetical protein
MSIWFDPTGRTTYGIGICDRCKIVHSIEDLYPDPNSPGLRVCLKDLDQFDPYRLPARQTERINLPFNRPDVDISGSNVPTFALTWFLYATEDGGILETEDLNYLEIEPWEP